MLCGSVRSVQSSGMECRVAGDLKVCSASFYFVPRPIQEPIFRLPFRAVQSLGRYDHGNYCRLCAPRLMDWLRSPCRARNSGMVHLYYVPSRRCCLPKLPKQADINIIATVCSCRIAEDASASGEDMFQVTASECVDIKINNRTAPYVRRRVCYPPKLL